MKQVHVFFAGLVQGVGFRFTTRSLANRYRVNGWVRNTSDGRVKAVFSADQEQITALLADLKETFRGNITDVDITELAGHETYDRFDITY